MPRNWILIAIFACAVSHPADAQTPDGGGVTTGEVFLNVTVTDKYGRWVSGLSTEHFKIFEEKRRQEITSFSAGEGPLSVGILIDVSGSADDYIDDALEGVKYFVKGCKTDTEYFVIAFDIGQELILDSTDRGDKVLDAIKRLVPIEPKALTAFFDALDVGLEKVSKGRHARKALLVFSDAQDNESKRGFSDIKRKLRTLDVNLYVLKSGWYPRASPLEERAIKDVVELTGQTGGRAMFTDGRVELAEAAYRTAEELRYQYRLGFKPQINNDRAHWRDVDINVELPKSVASKIGKVNVRARRGYNSALAATK